MKSLILFALLTISSLSFAQSSFIDAREDLGAISLVESTLPTTKNADLEAKVVKLVNNRMVLVVGAKSADGYVFLLNDSVTAITNVSFTAKDVIVVNYVDGSASKSLTVQALRYSDGALSDSLKILK